MNTKNDTHCFACSPHNEAGLQLAFQRDPATGEATAETALDRRFSGWQDIVHGGVVCTMLDEAMAHACGALGRFGATTELSVRFRSPVRVGQPVRIHGRVVEDQKRRVKAEASVSADGRVLAEATGTFFVIREE